MTGNGGPLAQGFTPQRGPVTEIVTAVLRTVAVPGEGATAHRLSVGAGCGTARAHRGSRVACGPVASGSESDDGTGGSADRQQAGRPEPWPDSLPMVDARDGTCHYLDGDIHSDDLVAGHAHFRTLCGRAVLAASLMTPTGPPWCEPCRSEARRRRAANGALTMSARTNRVWLRRLIGAFGRWSR